LKPKKLYAIVLTACLAGYIWLGFQFFIPQESIGFCMIKKATSIPCPSCGTSRSIISIFQGEFKKAFLWNPLGYASLFIMLVSPLWISIDLWQHKNSYFRTYRKLEYWLKKPSIYLPSILFILMNWIWNIMKGL